MTAFFKYSFITLIFSFFSFSSFALVVNTEELTSAVQEGNLEAVKTYIKKCVDSPDASNQTALQLARIRGQKEIAELLVRIPGVNVERAYQVVVQTPSLPKNTTPEEILPPPKDSLIPKDNTCYGYECESLNKLKKVTP